jgi:small ligand-binding sensory domain FIST
LRSKGLYIGRAIATHERELGRGDFVVRGIMGIDRESGAVTVQDFLKEGETIQFHLRDAATAREDLEMMLLPQTLYEPPRGGLLFTCNGRGSRFYGYPDGDVSIIHNALGELPLAGLFCAGEIGPVGGRNFVHGHTASLVLFREA